MATGLPEEVKGRLAVRPSTRTQMNPSITSSLVVGRKKKNLVIALPTL